MAKVSKTVYFCKLYGLRDYEGMMAFAQQAFDYANKQGLKKRICRDLQFEPTETGDLRVTFTETLYEEEDTVRDVSQRSEEG